MKWLACTSRPSVGYIQPCRAGVVSMSMAKPSRCVSRMLVQNVCCAEKTASRASCMSGEFRILRRMYVPGTPNAEACAQPVGIESDAGRVGALPTHLARLGVHD